MTESAEPGHLSLLFIQEVQKLTGTPSYVHSPPPPPEQLCLKTHTSVMAVCSSCLPVSLLAFPAPFWPSSQLLSRPFPAFLECKANAKQFAAVPQGLLASE